MKFLKSPYWEAVGVFGGMIIGSGMFALPYAVSVSGAWGAFFGIVIAFFAVLSIHLAYGEIVLNTTGKHRLPGYVALHLGRLAGEFNKISQIIFFNATLLIYGVLGGIFLRTMFGGSAFFWALAFLGVSAVVLFFENIEMIGRINMVLTIPLVLAIILVSLMSLSKGDVSNIPLVGRDPFFAFGIFVFALGGLSVIPDAREVFKSRADEKQLKSVITLGTTVPLVLYVLFIIAVLMAVNGAVSPDAISSLGNVLGRRVEFLGALVGFLAVLTSFLVLGYDLKEIYELDLKINKFLSWGLCAAIPPALFLSGLEDFVKLISIAGGIFIALDSFFVIFILHKIRKLGVPTERFLPFGAFQKTALFLIFAGSIIYEVAYQIM